MFPAIAYYLAGGAALTALLPRILRRIQLSRAKHPSLAGHARLSRRLAKLLPYVVYDEQTALAADGAPEEIVARRSAAMDRLAAELNDQNRRSAALAADLEPGVSDMQFTNAYRVPFQFREFVRSRLPVGSFADATSGVRIRSLGGHWSYDLGGSYGVNLLGYDFYKRCIERATERVGELGPVLGPYHPIIAENVDMLREVSGMDEVSFHMSGTEAVMQAVRLARYHTGRSQLVMFTGAYHGWWDGVQPGIGNLRSPADIYTLKDMSEDTLRVLRTRKDIACVLVNPLQALHPNAGASSDATLINSDRRACFDRAAYAAWLQRLREVCSERSIVLIFDEVFVGFRLGLGGAQAYFGVGADMVTYGKTVGGGLPIGVVCGKRRLMKRYREDRPTDVCFARGTFNSHPYVMASMNEFLRYALGDEFRRAAAGAEETWNRRAAELNARLAEASLPIRVNNLSSIWTLTYEVPSRYNWMLQYYLRAAGLSLSWVGTGRFIFSHNYADEDVTAVGDRMVEAATRMRDAGWWWQGERLSNRAIKRAVLKELAREMLPGLRQLISAPARRRRRSPPLPRDGRESWDRSARPSSDTEGL